MSRLYRKAGVEYVSVTTVLDCLPKPWLAPWSARTVAETAVRDGDGWWHLDDGDAIHYLKGAPGRVKDKAATRGSAVHASAVSGDWSDCPEYEAGWLQFWADHEPYVRWQEGVVTSETGYAGRFDFVADFPGLGRGIVDIKTAAGVRDTAQLQLAAYRYADGPWEPRSIEWGAVLLLHPDGEYVFEAVPCGPGEWRAFHGLHAVYNWLRRSGQLGEPREIVEL